MLNQFKIKFCFLQETFLRKNKNFNLSSYFTFHKDREEVSNYNPRGGVAILIHRSIKYKIMNINSPNSESGLLGIQTKKLIIWR